MHIPDAELFDVALELRVRLAVGGKLLVSMPESRPDVSAGEPGSAPRDSNGRLMIVRSVAQLRLLQARSARWGSVEHPRSRAGSAQSLKQPGETARVR